jgi:hypothetical protein
VVSFANGVRLPICYASSPLARPSGSAPNRPAYPTGRNAESPAPWSPSSPSCPFGAAVDNPLRFVDRSGHWPCEDEDCAALADLTGKEPMENAVRHISRFFCVAITLCSTASCARTQRREARAGLDAAVTQLSKPAGFDTIKVVYREFRSDEYERKCFYARAYVISGSSLPEVEALDVYVEELEALGWVPREKRYNTTGVLRRGTHERVTVKAGQARY